MHRTPLVVLAVVALLFLSSCGEEGTENVSTAPELLEDTFQIFENPAEEGDRITFLVSFRDQDGDMYRAELDLSLKTPDEEVLPIELDDRFDGNENEIEIRGRTEGIIRFSLTALAEYDDGEFQLIVRDGAGHESNQVSVILDVNPLPE